MKCWIKKINICQLERIDVFLSYKYHFRLFDIFLKTIFDTFVRLSIATPSGRCVGSGSKLCLSSENNIISVIQPYQNLKFQNHILSIDSTFGKI